MARVALGGVLVAQVWVRLLLLLLFIDRLALRVILILQLLPTQTPQHVLYKFPKLFERYINIYKIDV